MVYLKAKDQVREFTEDSIGRLGTLEEVISQADLPDNAGEAAHPV
jgi:hypothetical protein